MSWRIAFTFLRKVAEERVAVRVLVNFAVVFGFALVRRRKWARGIFFLGENKLEWIMSSHNARWSPGESAKEE